MKVLKYLYIVSAIVIFTISCDDIIFEEDISESNLIFHSTGKQLQMLINIKYKLLHPTLQMPYKLY